ncbi:MAG TPA: glycosyltransferase family 87 protein [Bacteroidales bacterium]|nr:glycosyltransferase family 87 protein [Bacteroidales bacterium]
MASLRQALLKDRTALGFTLFASLLFILIFTFENINGRFWLTDFDVYYQAARALVKGEPVYFTVFDQGSGIYKYSPVILYFFLPYTILPYKIAAILHFIVLCVSFWYSFILIKRILDRYLFAGSTKREGLLLSAAFVCVLIHLVKELHLGNINSLLLMLSLASLTNLLEKKPWRAGILFGLILLTKPFFVLLALPLLVRRYWKTLGGTALALAAGFLLPALHLGWTRNWALHLDWFRTMLYHADTYLGINTLFYFLKHHLFPGMEGYYQYVLLVLAGLLALAFILRNLQKEKKNGDQAGIKAADFSMEWLLLIAIIPNVFKTDSEHFLASAPLIAFIIYYISRKKLFWFIPVLVVLIFFYGANSTDLLGTDFSNKLYFMGLIGLSNLAMALFALVFFLDLRKGMLKPGSSNSS